MDDFYTRFERLCIEKDVSPSRAAIDIGLSNAAASGWASGSAPRKTTIRKLAEYFNVSYDYLKGEEAQKNIPAVQSDNEDSTTKELLDIIQNGTAEDRQTLLEMYHLIKRREKR